MQRPLLFVAAALLATGLAASGASAQSIQWTGHYYIAVGDAAGVPSSVVGFHQGWNAVEPIEALAYGDVADFAVRPAAGYTSSLVPDHRYDVLAVGVVRDVPTAGAVTPGPVASTTPSTNGPSGPTIVRSIFSCFANAMSF